MPSEITLGLQVGLGGDPAPREVMESLTQAQVSIAAKDKSGFDLSFAVSKTSPLVTDLLPSGYFDPPTRIIITVTIRGEQTTLIDGVITTQEVVPSDEAGKSVLSIKGEDVSRIMDLVDLTGFPFPGLAPELRVLTMLAKYKPFYGIVPLIIPSILFDVPNPMVRIPGQVGTDLQYIQRLAEMAGYTFFVQAGPAPGTNLAYWGPMLRSQTVASEVAKLVSSIRSTIASVPGADVAFWGPALPTQNQVPFLQKPDPIAIDWDGRSNVESLQFGFDGFQKTLFVVLVQASTKLPFPIPIPVPDINPISPPMGRKSPTWLKVSPLTGMAKFTALQAAAIALGRAAEAAEIVHGQGTLDVLRYRGILPARSVVEVRGAGITYDGQYFVESATHTIKPGSYKQSFTLSRNALIAGTGSIFGDVLSYVTSPARSLSGFAPPAPSPVPAGPLGVPLPPGPTLPAPSSIGQGSTVPLAGSI